MKLKLIDSNAQCPHCKQQVRRYASADGELVLAAASHETAIVSYGLGLRLTTVHLVHNCREAADTATRR